MTDKTDPNQLSPALARVFLSGTLERIKQSQPDFYPFLMQEIHAMDPTYQLNGLGDWGDIFGQVSAAIGKAASSYGDVLINRENAKTASMIAQDNAKSQIDQMNAALKAQMAQTNNTYAQQQLALQQQQLYQAGGAFGGSTSTLSPTVLVVGGVAVLGLILMSMHKGAA